MGLPLAGSAADAVSCASLAFDEVRARAVGLPLVGSAADTVSCASLAFDEVRARAVGLPLVGSAADAVSRASLAFDAVKRESRGPPVGRQGGRRGELTKVKDRLHVLTTTALSWKPRASATGILARAATLPNSASAPKKSGCHRCPRPADRELVAVDPG